MTRIIYGKKSHVKSDQKNIIVNESDFKIPPVDSASISLAMSTLNQMSCAHLRDKKVYELFSYRGIPMWWFCYDRLIGHFISAIGFLHKFLKFVERVKPTEICVEDDFSKFILIQSVCKKKSIKLSYSTIKHVKFKTRSKSKAITKKYASKLVTKRKIHSRQNLYKNRRIPDMKNKIIFASYQNYRRQIYDPRTQESKVGEFLLDEIVRMLRISPGDSVGIDFFSRVMADDSALKARLADDSLVWFPADALLAGNPGPDHTEFLASFEDVISSESFLSLFVFRDIAFGEHMLPFLKELLFAYYLPYWLNLIDSLENHMSSNRPRAVVIFYETAPTSLALISACRKLGIKTVSMQHGIIHASHPLYMHDDVYSTDNPDGFILPDRMLLFGEMTRRHLLDNNYPEDALVTFCNPRFLGMQDIKDSNVRTLSRHGLPAEKKKIILFAPPGLGDYASSEKNYNRDVLERLLSGMTDELFLIVKPHPSDDADFYARILNRHGKNNVKIINSDVIELISISDVLISTFSTTIIDAMCLETPVIQVKMEDVRYDRPYDGFEATLPTTTEDLFTSIRRLFSDDALREKLTSNGRSFVKQYYNIPISNPESILESSVLRD